MRMLKGPNKTIKDFYGADVDKAMRIKGKKGCGISIAVCDSDGDDFNDKLYEDNLPFLKPKHDYIKINRKPVDENGKVVAAIMAGVTEVDVGWIRKIWVDEKYRSQGLGALLLKHFEKKAKEKGAAKFIAEEIYDWNVDFFVKNGYEVVGMLPDLPKVHTFCVVGKDLE